MLVFEHGAKVWKMNVQAVLCLSRGPLPGSIHQRREKKIPKKKLAAGGGPGDIHKTISAEDKKRSNVSKRSICPPEFH